MSVSPIALPQPIPQVTTDTTRTQNQSAGSADNTGDNSSTTEASRADDSRAAQPSRTTGLTVDKLV